MSLELASREIVKKAASKLSPVDYIRSELRQMDPEDVVALATAYLLAQLKQRKRAQVREVEHEAQASREPRWGTRAWDRWAELPENAEAAEKTREWHYQADAIDLRLARELRADIGRALDEFTNTMKMVWTRELLDSEFAVGDGTVTTWGDATLEQHEARMAMHRQNALGAAEGYARHAAAVDEIKRAGTSTLREAVSVGV